jgi:delta 1-pyrroline-5-carboxylate dehydrogenase
VGDIAPNACAALITTENVLQVAQLQALLFEGSPEEATAIRRQLAERKGEIVAFVAQEWWLQSASLGGRALGQHQHNRR